VPHVHVHLIPRFPGDANNPKGGVRWVIPDRADYWSHQKS
jgi:diadenosine tetraphosphate (Ap4A) HIT family hydrolase